MYTDKVFKGATRPPMKFGIPMIPLICIFIPMAIAATWAFFFGGMILGFLIVGALILVLIYMKETTKKDDQRLFQWYKRIQNLKYINNKKWGGKMVAAPTQRRQQ